MVIIIRYYSHLQQLFGETKKNDLSSHHQGDTVEIQTGTFKGQQAIFKNYNRNDRITILLKLIGQQQAITLDHHDIVAV
jgi:transcription antitermination factor NusG